jgi:hypothetical protein
MLVNPEETLVLQGYKLSSSWLPVCSNNSYPVPHKKNKTIATTDSYPQFPPLHHLYGTYGTCVVVVHSLAKHVQMEAAGHILHVHTQLEAATALVRTCC